MSFTLTVKRAIALRLNASVAVHSRTVSPSGKTAPGPVARKPVSGAMPKGTQVTRSSPFAIRAPAGAPVSAARFQSTPSERGPFWVLSCVKGLGSTSLMVA